MIISFGAQQIYILLYHNIDQLIIFYKKYMEILPVTGNQINKICIPHNGNKTFTITSFAHGIYRQGEWSR